MDSESEDVSENSVDVPENWDSESEQQQHLDNMEPELEPEQKVFLQRLAEIDQNTCAAVSHGPVGVATAASSRFNFGLEQKEGGERSLLMSRWKNDKGYAGVVNRSPSNERKQRLNSRKKENNNQGTNRLDKGTAVAIPSTVPAENTRAVTVSRSNSNKSTGEKLNPLSRSNSPSFGTVMQQLEPSNKSSASILGMTPLSKPSTFTLPTTLGKIQSTPLLSNSESKSTPSFTIPAQLKPNDKPSTFTLPNNLMSTTLESKTTSNFEIPSLGNLSDKPSTFTLPTNLAQVKSTCVQGTSSLGIPSLSKQSDKPSTFTLPTNLGQLSSNLGVMPEAMTLSKLGDVTSNGGFTIPSLLPSSKTAEQKVHASQQYFRDRVSTPVFRCIYSIQLQVQLEVR